MDHAQRSTGQQCPAECEPSLALYAPTWRLRAVSTLMSTPLYVMREAV
jgi:hypothetical protein